VNYLFKEEKCIDMSKGIAIQTILMLLVGILVVGIVVYMVYRYMFSPQLGINECRARLVTWCTTCATAGWKGGLELGTDVANCASQYFAYTIVSGVDCSDQIGNNAATCSSGLNCPNTTICRAVGAGTTTPV
jgi:hypothetical protein